MHTVKVGNGALRKLLDPAFDGEDLSRTASRILGHKRITRFQNESVWQHRVYTWGVSESGNAQVGTCSEADLFVSNDCANAVLFGAGRVEEDVASLVGHVYIGPVEDGGCFETRASDGARVNHYSDTCTWRQEANGFRGLFNL